MLKMWLLTDKVFPRLHLKVQTRESTTWEFGLLLYQLIDTFTLYSLFVCIFGCILVKTDNFTAF